MITFYGVGTIVGGGFYALTGKVAGQAGMLAPLAFAVATGIAARDGGGEEYPAGLRPVDRRGGGTPHAAQGLVWYRCFRGLYGA